jgi:transcriptional regulator with XRE-family HTH domain
LTDSTGNAGQPDDTGAVEETIGTRARDIRNKRKLTLEQAAGLAGISKSYLSMLETGERAFEKRGLIEDVAYALGCGINELTDEKTPVRDRRAAAAAQRIPELNRAFFDLDLDDFPDLATRPLATLATAVTTANINADQGDYDRAGRGLAEVITELHIVAGSGAGDERRDALVALVEACIVAGRLARVTGHAALSVVTAQRGQLAAERAGGLDLIGLTRMSEAGGLLRMGARRRGRAVTDRTLAELAAEPGPTAQETRVAEARGMLHLHASMLAAREHDSAAETHLQEAWSLAEHTGERNHLQFHFGPTNLAIWELAIGLENGLGPSAAQRFLTRKVDLSAIGSRGRESSAAFDLARAWSAGGGKYDERAYRALDQADRLAPVQLRSDPVARDLGRALKRRARRRVWELDSLLSRLGVS